MRRCVVLLLLGSCAPPPREITPPAAARPDVALAAQSVDAAVDVETTPRVDPAEPPHAADAGVSSECPADFASGGDLCGALGKKCEYPKGTCSCATPNHCGGAAPNPAMTKELKVPRWLCTPSPKVLGPDGCPLGIPTGMSCSTPGKKCSYQPCCAFTMTCSGGKWVQGQATCPP